MEHKYSVFGSYVQPEKCKVLEKYGVIKSTLSRFNHLAFTSNYNFFNKKSDFGYYVYVIDLNLPYTPYCVTLFDHSITVLKWDDSGRKLLICDDIGTVKVYQCIEHLYSDWQRIFTQTIQDEKILAATWFCAGSSLVIDSQKKDPTLPACQRLKQNFYLPTAFDYGKKPLTGFVVVTKSGLVWVTTFFQNNTFSTKQQSISPLKRECFNQVDILPRKTGGFLLAFSGYFSFEDVQIYLLEIGIENSYDSCNDSRKPILTLKRFSNISLFQDDNELNKPIKFVKFLKSEESIVVISNEENCSEIQLWKQDIDRTQKEDNVKDLNKDDKDNDDNDLNGEKHSNDNIEDKDDKDKEKDEDQAMDVDRKVRFRLFCTTKSESFITSLAVGNESIFSNETLFDSIVVCEKNMLLKCLNLKDLQSITTISLLDLQTKQWNNPLQSSNNSYLENIFPLKDLQLSWSNLVLIGVDIFSQIHLFRLCPVFSPVFDNSYAQYFLEYSIQSGYDNWDILISLKTSSLRVLCENITKSFYNQRTGGVEKKFEEKILQMKIAFHRCLYSGNLAGFTCKSGDYQFIKNIRAISETIERIIRAKSDIKDSASPLQKLEQIIVNEPNINIDNVLNHKAIDLRDFIVEPHIQISFQHQFQWICDFTLYILSLIPFYDDKRPDKFGVLNDKEVLKILREILVIIRCWSFVDNHKGHQAAMPIFLKKQGVDVIGMLYRLLTKIAVNDSENVDESLIEECCQIPKHVTIAQMEVIPMSIGVASPVFFSTDKAFRFIFAQDPEEDLRYEIKFPRVQGAIRMFDGCRMDTTRFVSLGSIMNDSHNVRACSRCNALSMLKVGIRGTANRAWDQQWVERCSCGGFWRNHAYKFQNISTQNI